MPSPKRRKKLKKNKMAYYDVRDKRRKNSRKSKKIPEKWKPPTPDEITNGNLRTIDGTVMRYDASKKSWRPAHLPGTNLATSATQSQVQHQLPSNPPTVPNATPTITPAAPTSVTAAQLSKIQRQMETTFRALLSQLE